MPPCDCTHGTDHLTMGCDGLVPVLDTEVAQCTGHDVDAFRHTAKMGEWWRPRRLTKMVVDFMAIL